MKKLFLFFSLVLIGTSCGNEEGTETSKPNTFIRFYSGGYGDRAVSFEKTPSDNGYIILANTFPGERKKIKLIKTDETGAAIWTKLYPDFGSVEDYSGSGLQILPDGGYVVTGSEINSQELLLLKVDANGAVVNTARFGSTDFIDAANPQGVSANGVSVAVNAAGNYVVLGQKMASIKMVLMEVNSADLTQNWFFTHPPDELGNPVGGVVRGMFINNDSEEEVNWARFVDAKTQVVKTQQESQLVTHDLVVTGPGITELAKDYSRYGNAFALVGDNLTGKVFYRILSQGGGVLKYKAALPDSSTTTQGTYASYAANSIRPTYDGGLIILTTASVTTGLEETEDMYLIKVDAFGNQEWTSVIGSAKFKDSGSTVRQTTDGTVSDAGYAVLGTITQGGLEMIVFVKTNSAGKVE